MKKIILLTMILGFFSSPLFSQARLKLTYPKCDIVSENIFNGVKKFKTFTIETQADFDQYFKLKEGVAPIDFSKNIVLAGLIGEGNEAKFIKIDAATFDAKSKFMNVRFDIDDAKEEGNGKFCVVVVAKSFNFKKVVFLRGKFYNMSQAEY